MARQAAQQLGADDMVLYLVDHEQRQLLPMPGPGAPPRESLAIEGTLAGRAFSMLGPFGGATDGGGARLWLPLLNGLERMGVAEVVTAAPVPDFSVAAFEAVASLLAELVITRSQYSDTIERIRRRAPMRLAAEMLRAQLPPLTFSTGHMIISGILEPCYDVGGDAFDYAVNGDIAHLALFDAVGHGSGGGMRAVMLASLALAAYRNARRDGFDLIATYHHIDTAVRDHDRRGLITGVLAELDQRTGRLRVISAGHPSGLVIRRGKVTTVLPTPTALPVTLGDRRPPVVAEEALEPGDDLLFYTDGIIEARSADGERFGTERLVDFTVRALADELPLPETARRLVHAILAYQDDRLQDDATVLMVRFLGPSTVQATWPHRD
ncbi:PP2C family protein-serine/threonine phosphatase [Micromonospora sp. 4G57]|uniref:PP2C family protein-serine/threonine phosphatase n=1 Tax=Micromonospora sicca TaxID=2202420 RepID=A0ABU5JB36_9ACTN|nr:MULTISPECIES: PP2C family protein-serine/threonine phosphatase [unclassified Micromonospora]MDZ5444358.1 PP2C family protein-serine/threonine phosphatase [Micromonospora sp. 4G57]MDZ5489808.1 PP2C family protein-serine/threonine phosphatase [Micromonospora sp. 4G53]